MTQFPTGPFSLQKERDLHARLLADDPVAPSDLALAFLDTLTSWLESRNKNLHPNECASAAEDAILALIKNPKSYKPEKQRRESLGTYLRMSAQARLKNLVRSEQRHASRRAAWESVELSPEMGKYIWDEDADPAYIAEQREAEDGLPAPIPIPESLRARLTPQEETVLQLMDSNERKTIVFARILGITHLPAADQRKEVKRVKDRLNKRRERAGGRHG